MDSELNQTKSPYVIPPIELQKKKKNKKSRVQEGENSDNNSQNEQEETFEKNEKSHNKEFLPEIPKPISLNNLPKTTERAKTTEIKPQTSDNIPSATATKVSKLSKLKKLVTKKCLIISSIFAFLIVLVIILLVLTIVYGVRASNNNSNNNSSNTAANSQTTSTTCRYGFSGPNCVDECGIIYNQQNVKIINGQEANPRSWPSLAKISFYYKFDYVYNGSSLTYEFSSFCGSTVINRNTLLTSNQCFPQKVSLDINGVTYWFSVRTNKYHSTIESMFKVSAGYLGVLNNLNEKVMIFRENNVSVSSLINYPNFNSTNYLNDIAIVKLSRDLSLNQDLQTACLPDPLTVIFPVTTGIPALAAGFDLIKENPAIALTYTVQNANLTVFPINDCTNNLAGNAVDGLKQICAGVVNSPRVCEEDLGGPLFVEDYVNGVKKYILAGIVSYKDSCKYSLPGIFTRVSAFTGWINLY